MNQYKLGVGPMSQEIINAIISYPNKSQLMVVASRNQVDFQNAYVCDAYDLALKIKPAGILLCRDHCGPYFKDSDAGLTIEQAIEECKKTIKSDLKAGFDLIHIDISKINDPKFEIAKSLFDYALSINPNVMFEFGSEENTGEGISDSLARIIPQLDFFKQYSGARYFVSQTGSLTKNRQAGQFDIGPNTILAQTIHNNGLYFKEHNADYLLREDIDKRTLVGVDAMNIAPQLGYLQTITAEWKAKNNSEWQAFADLVYAGRKWERWLDEGEWTNKQSAVRVAGHYHYNTPEYKALKDSLATTSYETLIVELIHDLFDRYLDINNTTGVSL